MCVMNYAKCRSTKSPIPMIALGAVERIRESQLVVRSCFMVLALIAIVVFAHDGQVDFIYFRF